jgi:hypothetical protein
MHVRCGRRRAALDDGLSDEQLSSVARLADVESDREWAARAPNMDPAELARQARNASKPSSDEIRTRHDARGLRMWWTPDEGMLRDARCRFPGVVAGEDSRCTTWCPVVAAEPTRSPTSPASARRTTGS